MPSAVLVPETALLVPGAAGRTVVLEHLRAAALAAARRLVADAPARVVVVGPAARERVVDAEALCASLAPLGIAERHVGWAAPCAGEDCPEHGDREPAAPATAVGLRLLAAAGWVGPTTVVELAPPRIVPDGGTHDEGAPGAGAAGLVHERLAGLVDRSASLLVLGSASARRADASPWAADARAVPLDARLAADLADPTPAARSRLCDLDPALATELGVTGAAPWRLLATLLDGVDVEGREESSEPAWGMDYRVFSWRWTA